MILACNLASINLLRFLNEDGSFAIDDYRHAVQLTITAQEILVSNADYPTEKIGKNSEAFRPLGLGRRPGRAADGARHPLRLPEGA